MPQTGHRPRNSVRKTTNWTSPRQIGALARSYHTQSGRFGADDAAPADATYLTMRNMMTLNTSSIDTAMRRFAVADDSGKVWHRLGDVT